MDEFTATMTSKGQVTVPVEVRRRLGLKASDKLTFTIVGDEMRVRSPRAALETVLGSIKPLPGTTTEDIERQIDEASAAVAKRRFERMSRDRLS
ncbi:MAG TPA: AbrB/MazE/SpoVT family DNA-binding domain-containing protein [Thermomicrobiales bacterium]|jgi:AbrB family looped-hinge helix DNA binding protein